MLDIRSDRGFPISNTIKVSLYLNALLFWSGVRAEKPDTDLFYINKASITAGDAKKRVKLSLEEKMNNLHCYRLLRPDTEHSAPAHIVNIKQTPDHSSKRQTKLRQLKARKFTNIMKHKKDNSADYDPDENAAWPAKIKKVKPIVPKTQVQLEADFDKDLWTSNNLFSPNIDFIKK